MKRSTLLAQRILTSCLLITFGTLASVTPLYAELADDYVAGLRERGWHDAVLDYLDSAAEDPLASSAFLNKVGYERAVTLSALARQATSDKQRQTLLVRAATEFQNFADKQPDSPRQLQSLATAGKLFSELAISANNKAEKLPEAATGQREQLNQTARKFLEQAKKPLQSLLTQSTAKIKSLPKAAAMQNATISRQTLEGKLAEAKFLLAKIDFETARTYAPNSKARRLALKNSATAFESLYEDYEDKLVGFYARFYQGRSYQAAGKIDDALKCYLDIVNQPPIPNEDFRRLVTRSYRYRAKCHLANKDYDTAIKECREWLGESRGSEITQLDWLSLSYQLANLYEAQAAEAGSSDAKRLRGEARKLYREIAKNPGEFQRDAKAKMAAGGTGRDRPVRVDSFDEAFTAGKDALEQMSSAKLAARLAQKNNPSSVDSLTEQAQVEQTDAMRYFRQASQLADRQTEAEQLAEARYYLCYLYWEAGKLDDTAVMGEFLARRYPESKHAPNAANLALAAYERLYNQAKAANESTDYEAQRLTEMAELLVQRWPKSPQAAAGLNLLINIALRDSRLPAAEAMLDRLPPASRASAEMRLGGAFWTRHLQTTSKSSVTTDEAALALKQKAGKLLSSGFAALESKPNVTATEATGVLYLAQFLLADGQAKQAIAALEHSTIGPLRLIEDQASVASSAAFVQEAYKLGLRAYVSVEPPQREKAQAMMKALETTLGDKANAQQQLIGIYFSLGRQLQQQISTLTADGQVDKARAIAESFEDLLARVTKRADAASSWTVQSWIAQTNLQLGQGLRGKDATRYYQQAEAAYEALLSKAKQDPKFAPKPIAILAAKKKLADCLLAQGKHAEAFKQFTRILQDKPNMLELQQAAATALQQWGTDTNDAKRLEEAIRGALPQANKKNLVWGWLRLSKIADQAKRKAAKQAKEKTDKNGRVAKYQNIFFEARYNAAQARFTAAKLANGAARQKQLGTARQSLNSMKRLYPELGGPVWQAAYLDLLKQMEQEK